MDSSDVATLNLTDNSEEDEGEIRRFYDSHLIFLDDHGITSVEKLREVLSWIHDFENDSSSMGYLVRNDVRRTVSFPRGFMVDDFFKTIEGFMVRNVSGNECIGRYMSSSHSSGVAMLYGFVADKFTENDAVAVVKNIVNMLITVGFWDRTEEELVTVDRDLSRKDGTVVVSCTRPSGATKHVVPGRGGMGLIRRRPESR